MSMINSASAQPNAPQSRPRGTLASLADTHHTACEFAEHLAAEMAGLADLIVGPEPTPLTGQTAQSGTIMQDSFCNAFSSRNVRLSMALDAILRAKNRIAEALA